MILEIWVDITINSIVYLIQYNQTISRYVDIQSGCNYTEWICNFEQNLQKEPKVTKIPQQKKMKSKKHV